MRARLALINAGIKVELREILLKDKPQQFLDMSGSGTVPALDVGGHVLDESADIMVWALDQNDPAHLLEMPAEGWELIVRNDGPFKTALDHTKYASRHPELDAKVERHKAARVLVDLNQRLKGKNALFGNRLTLADHAILPFVRQFANTDLEWFKAKPWPDLIAWLTRFTASDDFARIMIKYPPWSKGDTPIWFAGTTPAT